MSARGLAVAALAIACRTTCAGEPPDVYHVEDPSRFGRPSRIIEPAYPKEALAHQLTGYVEVRGRITPVHSFEGVELSPGKPEAAIFVEPLRAALKLWEFYPVVRDDCFPSEEAVKMRVIFDIRDDKPKISVVVEPAAVAGPQITALNRVFPRYPRGALRDGIEAFVYTRSIIAPGGSVSRVDTKTYSTSLIGPPSSFEVEVQRALGKWTYPPSPQGEEPERIVCQEVIFQLRN